MNLSGDDIVWLENGQGGIVLGQGKMVSVLWKNGKTTKIHLSDIVMSAPYPCPPDWYDPVALKEEAKHCKECLKSLAFPELVKDFDRIVYAYKERLAFATRIVDQYKAFDKRI